MPETTDLIAYSRSGEGILARFKNFDFWGTIGGSQKSSQSEYTNQERNSVSSRFRGDRTSCDRQYRNLMMIG